MIDAVKHMLTRACDHCGKAMDMTKAVWWCPNGICCSEGCAREFTGAQR